MAEADRPALSVEQCIGQAEQCRMLAGKVLSERQQIMLEHIAGTWLRIAEDIRLRAGERPAAASEG